MLGAKGRHDGLLRKLFRLLRVPSLSNVKECVCLLVKTRAEDLPRYMKELGEINLSLGSLLAKLVVIAGGRSVALQMADLIKDENPSVRWLAIAVLGELGDQKLSSYLVEALDDPAVEVRLEAVNALRHLKGEVALNGLLKALHDGDYSVRVAAARSLSFFRKEDIFSHLVAALKDECPAVVRASLKTLSEVGAQEAISSIIPLLESDIPEIRDEARRALEVFARKFGFSGIEDEWITLCAKMLRELEEFKRRLGLLEEALKRGDLKVADEYVVELDETADELKLQLVKVGGWCLDVFEKEEERFGRLAKELDLLGAERAKALQSLRGMLERLLEEKGVVHLSDVPRASFKGVPVVSDEDILSIFEEMVREGFKGVIDGFRLVSLGAVEGKLKEIAKVYSRIRISNLADKVGVSEELLVKLLESSFSSGFLRGKIDEANRVVEFRGEFEREGDKISNSSNRFSISEVNERI